VVDPGSGPELVVRNGVPLPDERTVIAPTGESRLDEEIDEAGLERLAGVAQARFKTSEEVAVAFMRDAILGGIFRPGDHLNQERIAKALGMSRIPVRAGLRQLEAERLVTIHPFRGARVVRLTADDIDELYELRQNIECLALRYVAERLTPRQAEELREHAAYLDDAEVVDEEWIAARERFYDALFALSGRRRTADLVSALRIEIGGYIATYQIHRVHTGHVRFLDQLLSDDIDGAIAWHRDHLLAVRDLLRRQLESDNWRDESIARRSNPLHPSAGRD
jgi:DNA-binding GntR family transcriptional regulator